MCYMIEGLHTLPVYEKHSLTGNGSSAEGAASGCGFLYRDRSGRAPVGWLCYGTQEKMKEGRLEIVEP